MTNEECNNCLAGRHDECLGFWLEDGSYEYECNCNKCVAPEDYEEWYYDEQDGYGL